MSFITPNFNTLAKKITKEKTKIDQIYFQISSDNK